MTLLPLPVAEGCEDTKLWGDLAPVVATVKYTNTFSTAAPAVLYTDPKGVVEDLCFPAPELGTVEGFCSVSFFILFCCCCFVLIVFPIKILSVFSLHASHQLCH